MEQVCVDPDPGMNPADPQKQQLVCTEAQDGPSNWEEFTPELSSESGLISYRFRCPHSGAFRCTRTGLVFVVAREAGLIYRTVQWDELLLQSAGRTPAGPLFSIECPENAVWQLHLPHCETKHGGCDLLSVVHITDDGMEFTDTLEITDTHVVINVQHLSLFGLTWMLEMIQNLISVSGHIIESVTQFTKAVSGQVLLFLAPPNPRTQRQNLNMLLLPRNVPLDEVEAKQQNDVYIKVAATCDLIKNHSYSLHCPEAHKVQPKKAKFDLDFGPNYHPTFQIRLPINTDQVSLTIRDQRETEIWENDVDLAGPAGTEGNLPGAVQNATPEDTTSTAETLLHILDELGGKDFKTFKWHLHHQVVDDIHPIPVHQLEKAERTDVVDLMVQTYEECGAVEVTKTLLQKISRMDLVKKLPNIC
ncbi:NACHT, LRR and PYD domains-containing protein 1b allele 2-like [Sphaeramia orbicularis]|uniref:NACHT, LRR and PYD domains-containing protein 1b allele 2-like n=1 Tax=Sphaeramia orbicularis TaxID=375764 RepID=UPI001180473E|nr:NACHT, LRR and PYD domains-containing protein 1b allele 2-like [Sphaeramia orbicularis]